MKRILIALLFSLTLYGQKTQLKIIAQKDLSDFCDFEFQKYENEKTPYRAVFVNENIGEFKFSAILKNSGLAFDLSCKTNDKIKRLYQLKKGDHLFSKDYLLIYVDGKKIRVSEKISLLNIPSNLILFKDGKFQFLVFHIVELFTNSSYYTRPERTTIVLKFDQNNIYRDQFVFKSSQYESLQKIHQRYLKKDKSWK
ncbi:hypothetical protein [Chryseobacterium caseinilyticum]|uniref:Uncharacterized protein n=1 Tax=Chryseobacterium caseinilyticum TaxID=2771428 RepID=A0ABR8ZFJ5_9FLAO|nr:hypothetical protein [Chryseobacterium caseinilyticum]MBD8084045.1 hypothetical protein [Chryseobacterium caseinilyticum]